MQYITLYSRYYIASLMPGKLPYIHHISVRGLEEAKKGMSLMHLALHIITKESKFSLANNRRALL